MEDFLERYDLKTLRLMLAFIVLLIIIIQAMYVLWPQVKRFNATDDSYTLLQRVVSGGGSLQQQLVKIEADVESLKLQLHGDMAGLPIRQMESYIIGRLQKLSWESNVELISVKPGDGQSVQNFHESLFDVELKANYFNFFRWLQNIGQYLGFIVIKNYAIQPMGSALSDPELKITLTMASYRAVKE